MMDYALLLLAILILALGIGMLRLAVRVGRTEAWLRDVESLQMGQAALLMHLRDRLATAEKLRAMENTLNAPDLER